MDRIIKHGIVIADPVESMASLIAAMVRGLGHRTVLEVTSAGALSTVLASRAFALIVLDDALAPDILDLLRQLRADADGPNRTTPVIMMAQAPELARIAAARDAGVSEYLKKPFSAADLQKRIVSLEINPRGFIEAPHYAGPDRRRRQVDTGIAEQRGSGKPDA